MRGDIYLFNMDEYVTMSDTGKYSGYYASIDGSMDAQYVIDKFGLNWNRGNVLKYVIRAGRKNPDKEVEDLDKAIQYLKYEISRVGDR